jgi:large subunit ribosomal protein L30
MLHIKLVKSYFGNNPRNRATITALGLKNVGQVVYQHDTPMIRGMIHAVKHALEVTEGPEVAKVASTPRNNKGLKARVHKTPVVAPTKPAAVKVAKVATAVTSPATTEAKPAKAAPAKEKPAAKAPKAKAEGTKVAAPAVEPSEEKPAKEKAPRAKKKETPEA